MVTIGVILIFRASELLMYLPETGNEPELVPRINLKGKERKSLLFAQSCMDAQEFRRAAHFTEQFSENTLKFLHYYSLFLVRIPLGFQRMAMTVV